MNSEALLQSFHDDFPANLVNLVKMNSPRMHGLTNAQAAEACMLQNRLVTHPQLMSDFQRGLQAFERLVKSDEGIRAGSCRKCGGSGHLTFECRNLIKLDDPAPKPKSTSRFGFLKKQAPGSASASPSSSLTGQSSPAGGSKTATAAGSIQPSKSKSSRHSKKKNRSKYSSSSDSSDSSSSSSESDSEDDPDRLSSAAKGTLGFDRMDRALGQDRPD
ncbi:hypothetical protein KVV02_008101 [Mortierella alpina]|uniref:CCHC-type domain-containing protein n=1 Tax=Mortierella alpina TaxID=64518 RepID=A0A9P8A2N1_MORAP|nr:hypothetical protein KVV02_008101 [Mortierella alpina]